MEPLQALSYVLFALFMYLPMRSLFWTLGWDRGGDVNDKDVTKPVSRL